MKINFKKITMTIIATSISLASAINVFANERNFHDSLKDEQIKQETHRQEFEDGILKIFDSNLLKSEYNRDIFGKLVTEQKDNPSTSGVMRNPTTQKVINENKTELGRLASILYNDVNGDEYWAWAVSVPSFLGAISGKGNNEFQGTASITRQELAVALNNCVGSGTPNTESRAYRNIIAIGVPQWAAGHVSTVSGFLRYYDLDNASTIYASNATRQEIAYSLACYLGLDIHEGGKYWNMAGSGNFGSFTDITGVLTESAMGITDDTTPLEINKKYFDTFSRTDGKVSQKYLSALLALNDVGIMKGSDTGASMSNSPIRRGDFLILVNGCAKYAGEKMANGGF